MPAGTRFRLFPLHPSLSTPQQPETVWVSSPPGSIGPGPADERMYTVLPLGKQPYGDGVGAYGSPYLYFPPWTGPVLPPAVPDRSGHFDYLEPGTPQFDAAHLFGSVRFTLDIWERYFGRPIPWYFAERYDRLEMAPVPDYDNAQAGYGFLEVGQYRIASGALVPFILNFDIIAHEVGHLIISAEIGQPTDPDAAGEYYGFHESIADMIGLIASAHFDSIIDPLLTSTRGNLYVFNRLNRIGEVSDSEQIRMASNNVRLAAFERGWSEEHDLSLPLTGALFDILVDIFHELLVERRLISPEVEDLADQVERLPEYEGLIQSLFDKAYGADPAGFRAALLDARDTLGAYLAGTVERLAADRLTYEDVGLALLEIDREHGGRYQRLIWRNFDLRDIGRVTVGPRLEPPSAGSHAHSARVLTPANAANLPPMSYREQWLLVHGGRYIHN